MSEEMRKFREDGYLEFQRKMHELISQYMKEIGPQKCEHAVDDDEVSCCEDCADNFEGQPIPDLMLSEFVLAVSWVSMTDGEGYFESYENENLLYTHKVGLLTCALEG